MKFVCKEIWQKNHFILLREKESKLCLQEEQKSEYIIIFVLYSFQRTVSCYKYLHYSRKNKNIILHHILPNSPGNVFLAAFVILSHEIRLQGNFAKESFYLIAREGK